MNNKSVNLRSMLALLLALILIMATVACGKASASGASGKDQAGKGNKEEAATEAADNSVPITDLKVTCPVSNIRVGEELPLQIEIAPEGATNKKLKWSFSEADEYIDVSKDGVLTTEPGAEKHVVKVTAKTTDGSNLEQSFDLRIFPEIDLDRPFVAITFDDGPNPSTTNAILDVMEENYAKGTFFVLGKCAVSYPEEVKREYDLGMEVGSHTYSHSDSPTFANMSEAQEKKEIEDTNAAIEKAGVPTPVLLRPPYGAKNDKAKNVIKSYGFSIINWNLDTEDWKYRSSDHTYQEIMKAQDGDIILLHDIHEFNVDAVKRAVPELIDQGYQFVTVSELYDIFHTNNEGYAKNNDWDELVPNGIVHSRPEQRQWPSSNSQSAGGQTGSEEEATEAEEVTEAPLLQEDQDPVE